MSDARKRPRFALNWTAEVRKPGHSPPAPARAVNVSSEGIYLAVAQPVPPGECVECRVEFPAHLFGPLGTGFALICQLRVLRADRADDGSFGLGCRIERYETAHDSWSLSGPD